METTQCALITAVMKLKDFPFVLRSPTSKVVYVTLPQNTSYCTASISTDNQHTQEAGKHNGVEESSSFQEVACISEPQLRSAGLRAASSCFLKRNLQPNTTESVPDKCLVYETHLVKAEVGSGASEEL